MAKKPKIVQLSTAAVLVNIREMKDGQLHEREVPIPLFGCVDDQGRAWELVTTNGGQSREWRRLPELK